MGHKYAFRANLRGSLSRLVQETDLKLSKKLSTFSQKEKENWATWKLNVIKDIAKMKDKPSPIENIIRKGIQHIRGMQVVTKQADKNLGLVPIRGDIYAAMERKWLTRPSFNQVPSFPHHDILRRIENTIRSTWAIPYEAKEAWMQHARKATEPCPFYVIPKLHKKDMLGSRPISAQHSYMLAPLSITLTKILLPVQQSFVGITQDTKSFVKRIENFTTQKPFVFLTFDVEACYPSIDLGDAIKTLHDNIKIMQVNFGFWTKILQLIMFNNYVKTNGNVYRQMIGTATGTQVAPPFANLYLYFKFRNILNDPEVFLHERFIDDGFVLVSTKEHALRIINKLRNATNLNLTFEISNTQAVFLDLVIYKGPRYQRERRLDLKTYFKPTNRLLYLPWASNHPASMKSGIIIGEAIRTLRNSTDQFNWLKSLEFIFKGLMARGYPTGIIQKSWKKVRWEDRDFYINQNTLKGAPAGMLIFTRYHHDTKKNWKKLLLKYPFENIFPKKNYSWNKRQVAIMLRWPPVIVWSDFKKVGNYLISAKDSWNYPNKRKLLLKSKQAPKKVKRTN